MQILAKVTEEWTVDSIEEGEQLIERTKQESSSAIGGYELIQYNLTLKNKKDSTYVIVKLVKQY